MKPDDRVAADALRRMQEKQAKVREFEALCDRHGVEDPAKWVLVRWVEANLIGPVLDFAERAFRGVQGRN